MPVAKGSDKRKGVKDALEFHPDVEGEVTLLHLLYYYDLWLGLVQQEFSGIGAGADIACAHHAQHGNRFLQTCFKYPHCFRLNCFLFQISQNDSVIEITVLFLESGDVKRQQAHTLSEDVLVRGFHQ